MVRPFFSSGLILGLIEEIDISRIKQTINPIRVGFLNDAYNNALANSVKQKGLLHPIIIRASSTDHFEVVAGNRRYQACKSLGHRKIACHIVELDDKAAFEIALIENLQRKTLSPLEEARAFKRYVSDYGYGGMSELAEKLCKSPSYVAKRIKLLDLPIEILNSITNSLINTSTAEELFTLRDKNKQSELARLICDRHLSLKKVRELIQEESNDDSVYNINQCYHNTEHWDRTGRAVRSYDKMIVALRIAMSKVGAILEGVEDDWILYDALMYHKNLLHSQIDILIKEKKRKIPS